MAMAALSACAQTSDETGAEVVELALLWGRDLLEVAYVPRTARVAFADFHVGGEEPIALPRGPVGSRAEARWGAFTLRATVVRAARRIARSRPDPWPIACAFGVACVHALLLLALARHAPSPEGVDVDLLRSYLASSDGTIHESDGLGADGSGDESGAPGGTGTRAALDEGALGQPESTRAGARYAVAKAPDATDAVSLDEARSFGAIGLFSGEVAATASPWTSATLGSAGELRGDAVGDAFGVAGLALSGTGENGGGRGEGIGIGSVGTIGHAAGTGTGQDFGPGGSGTCDEVCEAHGHGRVTGAARVGVVIRCRLTGEPVTVSGRLPPEVIQRVVRANEGRFRGCYERGLARNPSLAGRVATKFVIARDGTVSASDDAGSDLADADVTSCVRRAFGDLEFPAPTGGVVTVTYPITFSRASAP